MNTDLIILNHWKAGKSIEETLTAMDAVGVTGNMRGINRMRTQLDFTIAMLNALDKDSRAVLLQAMNEA